MLIFSLKSYRQRGHTEMFVNGSCSSPGFQEKPMNMGMTAVLIVKKIGLGSDLLQVFYVLVPVPTQVFSWGVADVQTMSKNIRYNLRTLPGTAH